MAAGRNIKGITIEIGGDTTGLQNALKSVNRKIESTQAQLRDVNNLLKLDPSNTVLVAQKQELLKEAIANTTEKLSSLEEAQKDVTAALEAGKIGQEKYMAFQREVEETRAIMGRYESELANLNTEQDRLATNTDRLNKLFEATSTNVDDYADVLGSKLVTAIKNGSASSDQLKLAIEKIGKSAAGGKADIKQLTDALDTVDDGQAIHNLIQDLRDAGSQANTTEEQLDGMGKILTGGMLMEAADQISVVGDKITELGEKAKDAFTETQDATVKASTYFGETGEAAEQTAGIIKNVYAEGVGESMDAVSNAVITAKKNLEDLDETELTHITEQAITLDELYGIDMNETLRGVNSLMEQYGLTAQQAMDYIVKGTQNGLDKTNELGDNLSEYAGKFSQAGYSAQEYFQLLQNGLEGGAYNLDKVNDAINEVTTRLADGTIAGSLSQINEKTGEVEAGTGGWGEKVESVFKQWQQGGATQKQVIDAIVEDIQNTENQQDKLNKAALAFGTMGEDGNTKFIESLTSVGDVYDDVSGSAESMFDSSTTESQKFEASMRQLEQSLIPLGEALMSLANDIVPPLAAGVKAIGEFFGKLPEPVQNFTVILGALIAAFTALAPVITAVMKIVGTLGAATLGPIIGIIAAVAAAITIIIAVIKNWGAVTEWFGNLWQKVQETVLNIWTNIQSAATAIWSGIKQAVVTAVTNLKDQALQAVTGLKESVSQAWENMKTGAAQAWQNIKNFVVQTAQNLKQQAIQAFQNMVSGIRNALGNLGTVVSNGFQSAISFITSLPSRALRWGADFINGIAKGIRNAMGNVTSAVSDVAGKIRSFLHFSVPDEGPLTEYESWMPDFMKGLADGINKSRRIVEDAIAKLSEKMILELQVPNAIQGLQLTAGGLSTASSGKGNEAIIRALDNLGNRMISIMSQYFPQFANTQIVLDTGATVGALAPAMDTKMGKITDYKKRGI